MNVKIIDSIMGSGKTSYAIQKMNGDTEHNYIYITPFLSEVKRIKEQCINRKFYEPINFGNGKLESLHDLLLKSKNIASTHALFKMSTDVTKQLIKANDYILILDEVMDVIEQVPLKKDDLKILLNDSKLIRVEDDGLVVWNEDKLEYQTQYDHIKTMCLNKSLFMVNDCLFMWTFPVDIFDSFSEVYVMSYLFDAQIQRYYYDLFNINYTYYKVIKDNGNYKLQQHDNSHNDDISYLRDKVYILDDKINDIGEDEYSLSVSWFKKQKNEVLVQQLKNNIRNCFEHKFNSKSKDNMWTTFKDHKAKLGGKGYSKGFVAVNARATNEYAHKHNLAYCANIFLNPIVKQFFTNKDIRIEEDTYALSELLQWIWRSAIRNSDKINLYIPSSRMRKLLNDWLGN